MPRAVLGSYQPEAVQVLTQVRSPPDALGQTRLSWQAGPPISASVQPLGSEQAALMGLTAERGRLRIRLPREAVLGVGGYVRARAQNWKVVRSEPWQSFCLVIVEAVTALDGVSIPQDTGTY